MRASLPPIPTAAPTAPAPAPDTEEINLDAIGGTTEPDRVLPEMGAPTAESTLPDMATPSELRALAGPLQTSPPKHSVAAELKRNAPPPPPSSWPNAAPADGPATPTVLDMPDLSSLTAQAVENNTLEAEFFDEGGDWNELPDLSNAGHNLRPPTELVRNLPSPFINNDDMRPTLQLAEPDGKRLLREFSERVEEWMRRHRIEERIVGFLTRHQVERRLAWLVRRLGLYRSTINRPVL